MVRGYQRRIIHLKNTESNVFDEAFFVVGEQGLGMCEGELIAEANRIVSECSSNDAQVMKGKSRARAIIYGGLCFLIGAAASSVILIMLTLV